MAPKVLKQGMRKSELVYRGKKITIWQYRSNLTGENIVYGEFRRLSHKKESRHSDNKATTIAELKKAIDADMENLRRQG